MNATDLCYTPATELSRLIRSKALSPVELTVTYHDPCHVVHGQKIRQARESLTWILKNLNSEDRFNIVSFSDTVDRLFNDNLVPVKLVEYLAAGRPVVSTPMKAADGFADSVAFVDGAKAFAEAVRTAASEDTPAERRRRVERAGAFSWERRIDELEGAIEEIRG